MKGKIGLMGLGVALCFVIFALRLAGLIGSMATGVGIVGMIVAMLLIQLIPQRFLRVSATTVFIAWTLLSVGLPTAWNLITKQAPFMRAASEMRAEFEDLRGSELIRPSALIELEALRRFADELEEKEGLRISEAYKKRLQQYERGQISFQELLEHDSNYRNWIMFNKKWRDGVSDFYRDLTPPPKEGWLQKVQKAPKRSIFWGLGIFLLVGTVLAAVLRRGWIFWLFLGVVLLIGLLLLLDQAVWGAGTATGSRPLQPPATEDVYHLLQGDNYIPVMPGTTTVYASDPWSLGIYQGGKLSFSQRPAGLTTVTTGQRGAIIAVGPPGTVLRVPR